MSPPLICVVFGNIKYRVKNMLRLVFLELICEPCVWVFSFVYPFSQSQSLKPKGEWTIPHANPFHFGVKHELHSFGRCYVRMERTIYCFQNRRHYVFIPAYYCESAFWELIGVTGGPAWTSVLCSRDKSLKETCLIQMGSYKPRWFD